MNVNSTRIGILVAIALMLISAASAQDRPKFLTNEFDIHFTNSRDIFEELGKTVQTKEFQAIATAVAAYYGIPPSESSRYIGIAKVAASYVTPNPRSEERRARFPAPDGYTTCSIERLSYDPGFQAGPSDVTWNMTVQRTCHGGPTGRGEDQAAFYIVVPKSYAGTRVAGRIRITYVQADPPEVVRLTRGGKCMAQNTAAWLCVNKSCSDNVKNANPKDARQDRWLANQWESCDKY